MPIVNGKEVLRGSPEFQATLNARGGINKTSSRESQGLVTSGSTGTANALVSPTTAINSSSLAPQPSFVLPPTPTPTKGANLSGLIEAQTTQQTEQQKQDLAAQEAAKAANAETAKTQSFQDYIQSTLGTPTKTELTSQLYNQEGVDSSKLEVNQLNNQILAEQNALRRQFEALDKANPEGLSAKGIQDRKDALEKESLSKQADLAILQMAAQGRYDSAKEIADRAIEAQLEKDRQQNEALKFIYEENKDLFNKSEQRAFDIMLADRERSLNAEEDQKKLLASTKLSALQMAQTNGAPGDVLRAISTAETPEDVIRLGGQWGSVDMLDQQYKKIRNATAAKEYDKLIAELNGTGDNILTPELREKIGKMPEAKDAQVLMTLNSNLHNLQQLYTTYGTWNPINREAAKRIASLRAQLEIDIAVAGGQGAISEQEADRYSNMVGGKMFERGSSASKSIDEAIKANDNKIKGKIDFVQSTYPGSVVFEPFAQFLEQKEAEAYIEQQLNGGLPLNDGDAINSYLESFKTSNSTPSA